MKIIDIKTFHWQQMSNTVSNTVTPMVHLFWEPPMSIMSLKRKAHGFCFYPRINIVLLPIGAGI